MEFLYQSNWPSSGTVQAIGAIVTAIIAWLVFREARSIKQIQWLSNAADKWQDFNKFLVENECADRWEAILSGNDLDTPLSAKDKRMLLMYFNIQMIEYKLIKKRIVPKSALAAMRKEFAAFRKHSSFIGQLLEHGGYAPEYVKFVRQGMDAT